MTWRNYCSHQNTSVVAKCSSLMERYGMKCTANIIKSKQRERLIYQRYSSDLSPKVAFYVRLEAEATCQQYKVGQSQLKRTFLQLSWVFFLHMLGFSQTFTHFSGLYNHYSCQVSRFYDIL